MAEDKALSQSSAGNAGYGIALGDHVPFTLGSPHMARYIATMSPERREVFEVEMAQVQARNQYQKTQSGRQTNLSTRGAKPNITPSYRAQPLAGRSLTTHKAIRRPTLIPLALQDPSKNMQAGSLTQVTPPDDALHARQNRCRLLISEILQSAPHPTSFLRLWGHEAQIMVDFLDIVSQDTHFGTRDRRLALALLCSLAKSGSVFPRSYQLTGVETGLDHEVGGAFSDILKGRYKNQTVCIKALRTHRRSDTEHLLKTLAAEAVLWAHLQHKNVVPFYGVFLLGDASPRLCLVSPWMNQGNIYEYIEKFPGTARMGFISDILDGLSYLHDLQIVHGDLKATNILVSDDGRALITDFGLSFITTISQLGLPEMAGGTTRWMAPELLTGEPRATKSCDIWSFACVCYEILTGKIPYHQYVSEARVLLAVMKQEIPLRPTFPGETNDKLWELLVMCWNFKPEERPDTSKLQELITRVGIRGDRSRVLRSVQTSSTVQLQREGPEDIDYVRLEEILLRVSQSSRLHSPTVGSSPKSSLELTQSLSSTPLLPQSHSERSPVPNIELRANSGSDSHRSGKGQSMSDEGPVEQAQEIPRVGSAQSRALTQLQEARTTGQAEGYPQSGSTQHSPIDIRSFPYENLDDCVQRSNEATNPDFNGSCADVFIGNLTDGSIRIKVAIKVLRVTNNTAEKIKKYLVQETALWRRLDHPNVLRVLGLSYDYGRLGCPALIIPYCEKGTVNDYLKSHSDVGTRLFITTGIAEGLQYLHENDVIHGDLKPSNILIHDNGYPLLCDFGFFKIVSQLGFNTITTRATGAARYQAPEQLQGSALNKAVDVYAFALSSYEIWTGKQPFHNIRQDTTVMMNIILHGARPEYPKSAPPGTGSLWKIFKNCWEDEPEERLDMGTVLRELKDISIPTL